MTGQEIVELAKTRVLELAATVKPDGNPHLSPIDVNIVDGKIYIGIDEGTARRKNLERNPNITVMMADGWKRQAIIEGKTKMLDMKSGTTGRVREEQKKKYGWTTTFLAEVVPEKIFTYKSAPKAT